MGSFYITNSHCVYLQIVPLSKYVSTFHFLPGSAPPPGNNDGSALQNSHRRESKFHALNNPVCNRANPHPANGTTDNLSGTDKR